jgi:type II secretory pathway pseudopilin PulG
MKGKKIYKDNKGMSIVEVIIAITILSVVIVPVFQALTTAMVYNSKARVRQNLTLTAESIMETFKGYSLDNLKTMFGDPLAEKVAGVTDGSYGYEPTTYIVGGEEKTGAYKFTITGFKQNNRQYNAEISVVPNGTQEIYEVRDVSTTTNAVFQGDRNYDKDLKNKIFDSYKGNANSEVDDFYSMFEAINSNEGGYKDSPSYTYKGLKIYPGNEPNGTDITTESLKSDNVKNYIKIYDRTTTVEINGTTATVSIEYHYKIENYPYVVMLDKKTDTGSESDESSDKIDLTPDLSSFEGESTYDEVSETVSYPDSGYLTYTVSVRNEEIYNNATNLERLYMYYYPLYEKEDGTLIKDIINIKNNANINFNAYLIKQVASDLSNATIELGEKDYSPEILLSGTGNVYLYHNLNINVATGSKKVGEYIMPASFKGGGDYTASSEFVKKEVLSYIVTVKINDGTKDVCELESTMNEKINSVISVMPTGVSEDATE